jgi:hypothetical protein
VIDSCIVDEFEKMISDPQVCFAEANAPIKTPSVELKPLPSSLCYADETYPVIVNADLDLAQNDKLLGELRKHHNAIEYTIDDLISISPAICMHRIYTEEWHKPTREPQRRLNHNMTKVVWKEIHNLLDANIIY